MRQGNRLIYHNSLAALWRVGMYACVVHAMRLTVSILNARMIWMPLRVSSKSDTMGLRVTPSSRLNSRLDLRKN